ncbi:hypothetical protein HYPSUDRAFT_40779 [Hypholoma sublateritium FD-334 SS-4]|uniref:Uncharacterized protein n=1 Tax=Hypholoma sublateritium (strain FD-334 SS-4) TaxID=945553 RepID=A0A0D2L6U5_HYPSF|nr:hypothetical protein HYPSUDRAFT_40779 [Hypholoma sublateritium FD-334 SS-4]
MPHSYESLATTADEEAERKFLVEPGEDFTAHNARAPSKKFMVLAYALLILTILLAGANLATSLRIRGFMKRHNGPIDALPRPDIFVGLPEMPQTGRHKVPVTHVHENSPENA